MAADKRQAILEALALELQEAPGGRITTARLAAKLGVSEAALYRHFPSKKRMLEGLLQFAEDAVFRLLNQIMQEEMETCPRCERSLFLLLGFAERNPGITRLLLGDALMGEDPKLHLRVGQFFQRFESHLRQILRESGLRGDGVLSAEPSVLARVLLAHAEGKLRRYVRTGFNERPLQGWPQDWALLAACLFPASAQT